MKEFEQLTSFTFKAAPNAKSTVIAEKEEVKGQKSFGSSSRKVVQLDMPPPSKKEDKKQKEI